MKPFQSAAVESKFDSYPPAMRRKLLALRSLIFETATNTAHVGELEETLKWGEPAYVTRAAGAGSTLRIDWKKSKPAQYAMYFNCRTNLVSTFRTLFPTELACEGNRAIVFQQHESLPAEALAFCIAAALTYHRGKGRLR